MVMRACVACSASLAVATVLIASGQSRPLAASGVGTSPTDKAIQTKSSADSDHQKLFAAAIECSQQTQLWHHASALLHIPGNSLDGLMEITGLLDAAAVHFVRDDEGQYNAKADKQAFAAAVTNITPTLLAKACTLSVDGSPKDVFGALLCASDSFVLEKGCFERRAFNAALDNLTAAKLERGALVLKADRLTALSYILSASGRFADKTGTFNAIRFDNRFNAIDDSTLTGEQEARIGDFLKLMKP